MKKWERLPEKFKNDAVREYYDILRKRGISLAVKRFFDIILALIITIIALPFMMIIAIWIKLDSRGPVFFRQRRVTTYGRVFRIFKFRTMVTDAEKRGTQVTVSNDSRVTGAGRFLRKCRLDELPQLFNVLKGDMSFVGTRPEVERYVDRYTDEMNATLLMPAGITSLASIKFKDNEGNTKFVTSKVTTMYQMFYKRSRLEGLDLSTFDFSRVTNMADTFNGCTYLKELIINDDADFSKVQNMSATFANAGRIETIDGETKAWLDELDMSNWDLSSVTTMSQMFYATRFKSLNFGENTNSIRNLNAYQMFYNCDFMPVLDLSGLNTEHVTTMQEMFCGISNKVARLGKDRLDKAVETLLKSFRERFRYADINALDFSDVLEFDRFIRTNVTASNIIGCSMVANGIYDSHLREYDMVVFNQIRASVKTFEEKKDDKLATAAQSLLDEWEEHLASGQSVTRMLLRLELKWCLGWPRWLAEDFGIKSESDWIAYMRDYALKFHKQCYGVVPKWIDEDFPLPQNGEGVR